MILRFYDPIEYEEYTGRITFDDLDIRKIRLG